MTRLQHALRNALSSIPLALVVAAASISVGHAEEAWKPKRTVEIVVPSAAGGGLDVAARSLQSAIQAGKLVDVPTVIVNKPGGSTALGVVYVNRHPGSGEYIGIQAPPMLTNAIVGLSDIDIEDVTPLGLLVDEDIIFSVNAKSRFANGQDLIKALLKDPQSVSIGISSALGAHSHLAATLMMRAAGGNPNALKIVVFGSGSEAATAVLGGHVDVAVTPASSILGHKAAGTLRVVGVPSATRRAGPLADVPTWREQGVDYTFGNWRFVFGPKGMSPPQIAYWDKVLAAAVERPEWKALTVTNNWTPNYRPSNELRAFLIEQRKQLSAILAELGMAKK